jgi:hypothetical protein
MARIGFASALVFVLSACGAGPIAGDDEIGSDTETATLGDSTSDEGGTSEATDGTDDGDTETDTETDGDTGMLECPLHENVTARFRVTPSIPIATTCRIIEESLDPPDLYELRLECDDTEVTVNVESTISPLPTTWDLFVLVDYRVDGLDRWLAIHRESAPDTLVLGAVAASVLDPPGTTLGEFFHDPTLTVADEQPCESSMDMCGEFQRLGLGVSLSQFGEGDRVFDHGTWYANFLSHGYSIAVEYAERRLAPSNCADLPDEWYQLLAVWFPSD